MRLRYDETQLKLDMLKQRPTAALVPIAESSIRAIEFCQQTVTNEDLAQSLMRLAITLRSLS